MSDTRDDPNPLAPDAPEPGAPMEPIEVGGTINPVDPNIVEVPDAEDEDDSRRGSRRGDDDDE